MRKGNRDSHFAGNTSKQVSEIQKQLDFDLQEFNEIKKEQRNKMNTINRTFQIAILLLTVLVIGLYIYGWVFEYDTQEDEYLNFILGDLLNTVSLVLTLIAHNTIAKHLK